MTFPYELKGTILKADKVSVTLDGCPILRDVNFEIRDIVRPDTVAGQVVGLLGPSGIGKTTLFRILAGLDQPDSGRVTLGDDAKPIERGMVGVVAQNYPLFDHRTVLGNLMVAGRQAGLSRQQAREKAVGFLKRFDLEDKAEALPAAALRRPAAARGDRPAVHVQRALPAAGRALLRARSDGDRQRC